MDFTPLIQGALKPVLSALLFIVIIGLLRTPKVKGSFGELFVKFLAMCKLPKNVYVPLHNVTLPTSDGTSQVDHIFVSQFGVFVVETKNMKGSIVGGEKQKEWIQQFPKNKYKFQNPLLQNYKHVITLESFLEIPPKSIKSVIAFMGECKLKTDMPENVTHGIGYVHYIKSFSSPILTDEQVQSVVAQIKSRRLEPSGATAKEHVRQLKARQNSTAERKCP